MGNHSSGYVVHVGGGGGGVCRGQSPAEEGEGGGN